MVSRAGGDPRPQRRAGGGVVNDSSCSSTSPDEGSSSSSAFSSSKESSPAALHSHPQPLPSVKLVSSEQQQQDHLVNHQDPNSPDWNIANHKLYDRQVQEQALQEAYDRCIGTRSSSSSCTSSTADISSSKRSKQESSNNRNGLPPVLTLITGPCGTGKTQLAMTLKRRYRPDIKTTTFLSGKFDVLQKYEPFKCFVQAFTQWVTLVQQQQSQHELDALVARIVTATDHSTSQLVDVMPALSQLFSSTTTTATTTTTTTTKSSSSSNKPSQQESSTTVARSVGAEKQFIDLFCCMVREICTPDRPLVLFLDDLQWAEAASLDLLSALVKSNISGLVIVGACRGNEIPPDHYLSVTLRDLEDEGKVWIQHIAVGNLQAKAVHEMVCDVLRVPVVSSSTTAEDTTKVVVTQISDFLYQKTQGNIFFCLLLLRMLYEEGFLYVQDEDEPSSSSKPLQWTFDKDEFLASHGVFCNSATQLLQAKLSSLEASHQQVLHIAACIGAEFEEYLLSEIIVDGSVAPALQVAQAKGFIVFQAEGDGSLWRFAHDMVQLAVYSFVEQGDAPSFHLNIGRRLLESLSPDEIELNLFLIANQYYAGLTRLEREDERYDIAALFLAAGEKAASSSAFGAAAGYLSTGISLLGPRHWRTHYDLSLALFNATAEVEYCNANHTRVDELIEHIHLNARNFQDKIRSYTTQVYTLSARSMTRRCVEIGLEALEKLGYPFPSKISMFHIVSSIAKTNKLLRDKTDINILKLPHMEDPDKLAATRLMNLLFNTAIKDYPMLSVLIGLRNVRACLKYGISRMSCVAFCNYAMLLCNGFRRVDEGIRFAALSLRLQEKFKAREWLARVYSAVYGFCFPWKEAMRDCIPQLHTACRSGINFGDIEMAHVASLGICSLSFHAGLPLQDTLLITRSKIEIMLAHQQEGPLILGRPLLQILVNITSPEKVENYLSGDVCDIAVKIEEFRKSNQTTTLAFAWHLYCKAHLCFLYNDYAALLETTRDLNALDTSVFSPFMNVNRWLFEGMSELTLAADTGSTKQGRNAKRIAKRCLGQLKDLAKHSFTNYGHKVYLMEGELLAFEGQFENALDRFKVAAETSHTHGFLREEALAWERIAGLYLAQFSQNKMEYSFSLRDSYITALDTSIACYQEWGCTSKAHELEQKRCYGTQTTGFSSSSASNPHASTIATNSKEGSFRSIEIVGDIM